MMRTKLFAGVAFAALIIPGAAFAQSTGSTDLDDEEIVVTASRHQAVSAACRFPIRRKAKGVLTQEFIARQTPGQTRSSTSINLLPGVSFQNNDPFGSAGGTLSIRGFDSSRIASDVRRHPAERHRQLCRLFEPAARSRADRAGQRQSTARPTSTARPPPPRVRPVNYRTIVPTDDFGARMIGSVGDYNFFRVFGLLDTGVFTPWGTKAWLVGQPCRRTTSCSTISARSTRRSITAALSADRQQRRLHLGCRPLQREPQQLLRFGAAAPGYQRSGSGYVGNWQPFGDAAKPAVDCRRSPHAGNRLEQPLSEQP